MLPGPRAFVPETGARPVGMGLPRVAWVKLNRLQTGVGRFHSSMQKWGLAPSPNCECGTSEQTADHVGETGVSWKAGLVEKLKFVTPRKNIFDFYCHLVIANVMLLPPCCFLADQAATFL